MIEVQSYIRLPEIVPQAELQAWRDKISKVGVKDCPPEVVEFIDALADKLSDFVPIRIELVKMSGYELSLGGVRDVDGIRVMPFSLYDTPVPYLVAADHRAAMYRIFKRKGKQGLIDFCKARVKGTELERILQILNVVVFRKERSEFQKIMDEISATKKVDL